MATVNFLYRSKTNIGNLTVRFIHTKAIDISTSSFIVIPKNSWDQKKQRVKNTGTTKNAGELNKQLLILEATIISNFTMDYMAGEVIDQDWLKKKIHIFFNRPLYELEGKEKMEINNFFVKFCYDWIDQNLKTGKWKSRQKKPLTKKVISQYEKTIERVEEYQSTLSSRLRIKDINLDFCDEFCKALKEDLNYGANTINREISRIKFFCARAEELGLEVNHIYKNPNFSAPTEDTFDPYLNPNEIQSIINLKIKEEWLDNIRDWFVIGLHTGLRISDFLGVRSKNHPPLNKSFISGGYIQRKTLKTGKIIAVPIHENVRKVLDKRNGEFPYEIPHQHFNDHIKDICEDAKIDKEIYASVFDGESKRKKKGTYKKYEAVSSHICRRSFVTNNLDKMPRSLLMKIGGWETESAFIRYIKKSGLEYAEQVAQIWEKELTTVKQ